MDVQILLVLAGLSAILLIALYQRSQANKQLSRRVRAAWGQMPEREYTYEEFARIRHYYDRKKGPEFSLDEITWRDLDLDSVFLQLNHTWSSVGEEALYRMLRTPEWDPAVLAERERRIRHFSDQPETAWKFQECFARLGRARRIALSDYLYQLPEAPALPPALSLLQDGLLLTGILLIAANRGIGIWLTVGMIVLNIVTYYQRKARVESYFSCISYLLRLAGAAEKAAAIPDPELAEEQERLRKLASVFRKIRRSASLIANGDSMGGSFADMLLDYVRMITQMDLIAFARIRTYAEAHLDELDQLMFEMGQLECCLAVASYRAGLPVFCRPELSDAKAPFLEAESLCHPLIEEPVPNSIRAYRGVLLTGSNASGKSTFLKTLALAAVMAQTVHTVTAKRYRASRFRVFTSLSLRDNLQEGESYYMAEIRSLKRILDAAKEPGAPVLCFVDEVLRGTNTVERIAASTRLLESLTGQAILPFAATHDLELTDLLDSCYDNYHFEEEIREGDILFRYQLKPGPARTRNAIRLLAQLGYDPELVAGAEAMAEHFEKEGTWEPI